MKRFFWIVCVCLLFMPSFVFAQESFDLESEILNNINGELVDRLSVLESEINTEDGVDDSEIQYLVQRATSIIQSFFQERLGGFFTNTYDRITGTVSGVADSLSDGVDTLTTGVGDFFISTEDTTENTIQDIQEEDSLEESLLSEEGSEGESENEEELDPLTEEDFMDTSLEGTGFNEYRTDTWPDENGTKIAKVVDPYGIEQYTSDGKHFYDNPYDAAHSGSGLSHMTNTIGDAWDGFTDFFSFKGKLPDTDKELQREIAREVLKNAKTQKEKDVEKAYEKLSNAVDAPSLGDIPAKAIIAIAQESHETDFAGGALEYIEQRKEGKTPSDIRENSSEILTEGYGTFGQGVSFSTTNKQAQGVLLARYEEVYQRYLLAQEFGRTE